MDQTYLYLPDILKQLPELPTNSIISRSLVKTPGLDVTVFGFSAGQELSEHTAAYPAVIQVIDGEADITLGSDSFVGRPGSYIYMPPHLPHSLKARTAFVMLLTMAR